MTGVQTCALPIFVVFLIRDPHIGPRLSEIIAVEGVNDGQYVFRDLKQKRALKVG